METRANYVIVGIFTLVSILAAFGFIYWTAAIGDRGETVLLRVRIPGSASGLGRGSAVLFNGVKVGDVQRVYIDVKNPAVAIADTQIDRVTPITRSTQAVIGIAGLTGQANIEVKGSNTQEPNLLAEAEAAGKVAEITADPSAVTNLLQRAQDIFARADSVLNQIEGFTKDVRGPLTDTVKNTKTFSDALARNADGIDRFLESVSKLSVELAGVSGKLDGTLKAAEDILKAVDPQKIKAVVANVETFTQSLSATSGQFDDVIRDVRETVDTLNQVGKTSQASLAKVNGILDGVDPATVRDAITNIGRASRSASTIAADISRVTATVGRRSDDIDRIIGDTTVLAKRLSDASSQLPAVVDGAREAVVTFGDVGKTTQTALGKVNGILDGVDPATVRDAITNIGQASRSASAIAADISRVTEKVGRRSDDIDRIIGDTTVVARRLSDASGQIATVVDGARQAVVTFGDVGKITQTALGKVTGILDGVDPGKVRSALSNIDQASRTANAAIADIAKVTEKFGSRAKDISRMVDNATELAQRLNAASLRVDGILLKVDNLLGSGQAEGLVADASATLKSFKQVADTLNSRLGEITGNLAKFSGQGLRSVEALVDDSRRSINRIEQTITDLGRNPQRIITGGDGAVRQYDGRARH